LNKFEEEEKKVRLLLSSISEVAANKIIQHTKPGSPYEKERVTKRSFYPDRKAFYREHDLNEIPSPEEISICCGRCSTLHYIHSCSFSIKIVYCGAYRYAP